jgi:hypothetical protein
MKKFILIIFIFIVINFFDNICIRNCFREGLDTELCKRICKDCSCEGN